MAKRCKRPESVLVLVCTPGGDILMLERCHPCGFWQSVTGSLAWGESAPVAARRELWEETGITVGRGLCDQHQQVVFPIHPAWRRRYAPSVRQNREHWFVAWVDRRRTPRLSPQEHRRARWVPAARALRMASSWTNRALIRQVFGLPGRRDR